MSAEPMMDIDYASIDRIFKARDAKNARETAQRRTEPRTAQRTGQVPAQRNASGSASRPHTQGGKRLEQPVRRTRLEDMPERDEFRPQRRTAEQESSQRTAQRQRATQASSQRSRGGAHLETSRGRAAQNAHNSKAKGSDAAKTGGMLAGATGLVGAVLIMLNALLPSATAEAPANDAQKAENNAKPIHYYTEIEEENTIKAGDTEYYVEYGGKMESVDTTLDAPLDAVEETVAPEEMAPPYVPIEHVSDNLIDAMKGFEGLYLEAYTCPGGSLTIGYGHTAGVYEGQTITAQEARDLLRSDLASREAHVARYAEEQGVQLTQGQFDALVDFAFNLGMNAFDNSGLVEMIGDGDLDGAAAEMQKYVYAKDKEGNKVKLGGLVARRAAEAEWLYS